MPVNPRTVRQPCVIPTVPGIFFEDNMDDLRKIEITLESGQEITGYYTEQRREALDRKPKCKFVYDVRHGDEGWVIHCGATLEMHVLVNHGGTFFCNEEIPLDQFERQTAIIKDYNFPYSISMENTVKRLRKQFCQLS